MPKTIRQKTLGLFLILCLFCLIPKSALASRLSSESETLTAGDSCSLKVTQSKAPVIFSSNNPKVATVSQKGRVKAVSKGSATITARTGEEKLTCRIRVEQPYLSKESAGLSVGESLTLHLWGTKQDVSWSSSAKSVASVDQKGKVTALKKGSTKITAKAGSRSYRCQVTVSEAKKTGAKKKKEEKKSLTLKPSSLTLIAGKSENLSLEKKNVTGKARYSSSKPSVASVTQSGKVTGLTPGSAQITARIGSVKASCHVTVKENLLQQLAPLLLQIFGR